MFDEKDLQQIREHGLTPEQAETQLENFRRGFPFLNVVRAASIELAAGGGLSARRRPMPPWNAMKKSLPDWGW